MMEISYQGREDRRKMESSRTSNSSSRQRSSRTEGGSRPESRSKHRSNNSNVDNSQLSHSNRSDQRSRRTPSSRQQQQYNQDVSGHSSRRSEKSSTSRPTSNSRGERRTNNGSRSSRSSNNKNGRSQNSVPMEIKTPGPTGAKEVLHHSTSIDGLGKMLVQERYQQEQQNHHNSGPTRLPILDPSSYYDGPSKDQLDKLLSKKNGQNPIYRSKSGGAMSVPDRQRIAHHDRQQQEDRQQQQQQQPSSYYAGPSKDQLDKLLSKKNGQNPIYRSQSGGAMSVPDRQRIAHHDQQRQQDRQLQQQQQQQQDRQLQQQQQQQPQRVDKLDRMLMKKNLQDPTSSRTTSAGAMSVPDPRRMAVHAQQRQQQLLPQPPQMAGGAGTMMNNTNAYHHNNGGSPPPDKLDRMLMKKNLQDPTPRPLPGAGTMSVPGVQGPRSPPSRGGGGGLDRMLSKTNMQGQVSSRSGAMSVPDNRRMNNNSNGGALDRMMARNTHMQQQHQQQHPHDVMSVPDNRRMQQQQQQQQMVLHASAQNGLYPGAPPPQYQDHQDVAIPGYDRSNPAHLYQAKKSFVDPFQKSKKSKGSKKSAALKLKSTMKSKQPKDKVSKQSQERGWDVL